MPPNDTPAPFTPPVADSSPTPQIAPNRLPPGVPVTDVTIIIGFKDRHGNRQEIIHDIVDKRIVKCQHTVEAKLEKVKVEGQLVDFATTGEVNVKLDLKYIDK